MSTSKRNIWQREEVLFFLNLLKVKKEAGYLEGQRPRTKHIFKALETLMHQAGYYRDSNCMYIKYKNLKGEYYRDQRSNTRTSEFYNELDELLADKPVKKRRKQYSSEVPDVDNEINDTPEEVKVSLNEDGSIINIVETEISIPRNKIQEQDPLSPSCSTTTVVSEYKKEELSYQSSLDRLVNIQEDIKNSFQRLVADANVEVESDNSFIDRIMKAQENIMQSCTRQIVSAIKALSRKRRRRESSSSSELEQ